MSGLWYSQHCNLKGHVHNKINECFNYLSSEMNKIREKSKEAKKIERKKIN